MIRRHLPWLRGAAWFCVTLIAYLSLIPHSLEVRTDLPSGIEHTIAYAGTAGLMALSYPRRSVWWIVLLLFAYSGILEILQALSPDRHPGIDGALWSGARACIGGIAAGGLRATEWWKTHDR
jgi:hypothetical protein